MSGAVTAAVVGVGAGLGASALGASALTAASIGVGAASLGGSFIQSNAAQQAAQTQANAENKATNEQASIYNANAQNLAPYINQGTGVIPEINALEGVGGSGAAGIQNTLQTLPGYQFANYQGLKSVQNSATARGLGVSGAAQKGAVNYSTGLANQYYNNLLSGLQTTEQTGANAGAALAGVGATTGQGIAATTVGAGNALAQGKTGAANALAGGLGNVGSLVYANSILSGINQQGQGGSNGINTINFAAANPLSSFDPNAYSNGLPWSDLRLKENIINIGYENGWPIYEFNYTWSPLRYIGVIAQDISEKMPEAIKKVGDYFAVDYSLLGVRFREANNA